VIFKPWTVSAPEDLHISLNSDSLHSNSHLATTIKHYIRSTGIEVTMNTSNGYDQSMITSTNNQYSAKADKNAMSGVNNDLVSPGGTRGTHSTAVNERTPSKTSSVGSETVSPVIGYKNHRQRSTVNVGKYINSYINLGVHTDADSPPFLRGKLKEYWRTKLILEEIISPILSITNPESIPSTYGFQINVNGSAELAKKSLVNELMGSGNAIDSSIDELVVDFHTKTFNSYISWCKMLNCDPVTFLLPESISRNTENMKHKSSAKSVTPTSIDPQSISIPDLLYDLCLYTIIQIEAANFRFCPEFICWLFHQMKKKHLSIPPSTIKQIVQNDDDISCGISSVFQKTTIDYFYTQLKHLSRKEEEISVFHEYLSSFLPICIQRGKRRQLQNNERVNYDDFNEVFWSNECLKFTYHTCDEKTGVNASLFPTIQKSFRERATYISFILVYYSWFTFLAVLFNGIYLLALDIIRSGGENILGVAKINPVAFLISLTQCITTFAGMMTLKCFASFLVSGQSFSLQRIASTVYHTVWFIVFLVLQNADTLFQFKAFGTLIWYAAVGIRLGSYALSISHIPWIYPSFRYLETVSYSFPSFQTDKGLLGPNKTSLSFTTRIQYILFWVAVLIIKIAFDIQVLTQQILLTQALNSVPFSVPSFLDIQFFGIQHLLVVISTWLIAFLLFLLDSYVAFMIVVPFVGYYLCWMDGVGNLSQSSHTKRTFEKGIYWFSEDPVPDQFSKKCLPLALEKLKAVGSNTPTSLSLHSFQKVHDQFIMSLRELDLISNEEQCKFLFGDNVLGLTSSLPLFAYAGKVMKFVQQIEAKQGVLIAATVHVQTLKEFEDAFELAFGKLTLEALKEIAAGIPQILAHVCLSHSAIGPLDHEAGKTLQKVFNLTSYYTDPIEGIGSGIKRILDAVSPNGQLSLYDSLVKICGSIVELMVEFEKTSASTGMLHSPLLNATINILHILEPLETLRTLPSKRSTSSNTNTPADSYHSRSISGLIRLLSLPNELSGRLDGEQAIESSIYDRYESLKEVARRIYYLVVMQEDGGDLVLDEAERRLSFFLNSLYMPQLPRVKSSHGILASPSISVVTPHYNETVLYSKRWLNTANQQGITPCVYLKSLHAYEWSNFLERLGVKTESEAWRASVDAQGTAVSGELEVRLWASMRGQTLFRTSSGVMEHARAFRTLAAVQIEMEYLNEASKDTNIRDIQEAAMLSAEWFTHERFSYVIAAQRFAEHDLEDVKRRSELQFLALTQPLLSFAFLETSSHSSKGRMVLKNRCCTPDNDELVLFEVPVPGNPIKDGIGEGKPENQNFAKIFAHGRVLQTLDMNQECYFEEGLKLPNVLQLIDDAYILGENDILASRPTVCLGLREHIYTHLLSTSAFFMSQQEFLFGTLIQRLMASPLHVRFHYGHPDLFSKTWVSSRGGTAKASSVVNVSEDIFAGFNVLLRGGDSSHVECLQPGKGRDVGLLQISIFEAKISAGTAIALTTRDAHRIGESLDFFRSMSFYHTSGGFYLSNVLTVVAFVAQIYYLAMVSCLGIDAAILATNKIFLIGDINFLQWFLQLGLITILPLLALYSLEKGILSALWDVLTKLFLKFAPLFFMFEIQTKAYYFDQAMSFGWAAYMGTGRDFVLSHTSFDTLFRAFSHSHLYLGIEGICLLVAITLYGTFQSIQVYLFFTLPCWLFATSLILTPIWFNPFALEWSILSSDWRSFWIWMLHDDYGIVNIEKETDQGKSWLIWYNETTAKQYHQASIVNRLSRFIRTCRLFLFAAFLSYRIGATQSQQLLMIMFQLGIAAASILVLQIVSTVTDFIPPMDTPPPPTNTSSKHTARASFWSVLASKNPIRRFLLVILILGFAAASILVLLIFSSTFQFKKPLGLQEFFLILACHFILVTFVARSINIASFILLQDGSKLTLQAIDCIVAILMYLFILLVAVFPLSAYSHSKMIFQSSYANVMDAIFESRNLLHQTLTSKLKLKQIGELENRTTRQSHREKKVAKTKWLVDILEKPENKIGVRRLPLSKVGKLEESTTEYLVPYLAPQDSSTSTVAPANASTNIASGTGVDNQPRQSLKEILATHQHKKADERPTREDKLPRHITHTHSNKHT
jgi:1,3-beta-glucan synthase component/1,3-beta-glucan synthase subunit FKS1, domain-1